jgi:hypothetical protein
MVSGPGTKNSIPDSGLGRGWLFGQLLPQHAELVGASAISDSVATVRGYRSVTEKAELRRLGFSENQARVPALLLPVWDVNGTIALYQTRPDEPRVEHGKPVKYETVAGSRMTIDVPPYVRHQLGNPSIPLCITEGIRKADAAVSAGLCCIALLGVWNWRGTNELGGKVALTDWESIALNGRVVYIAFDSDVMTKPGVRQALERLKAFLESRHAHVQLVYLPAGPDGEKVGLDDYLAAGHSVDDLLALATDELATADDAFHSAHTSTSRGAERNLPFRTARAIAGEVPEQVIWYVPGYIAAGAVTELVGKIKAAGKTTWVTHAVHSIVTGTRFMDLTTTQTGVVYLTEQSPTSFRVALARAGLLQRDDVVVLFWRDTGGVAWPDVVVAAVEECRRRGCGVLGVDTLPRFAGLRGDAENNAGDADGAMAPLQLAAADGLAVVVVRHERKAGGEVGDSGRGSSAFGGAVDIVLALKRGEGATRSTVRVLHALSRFDETPGELVVELVDDGYVALGDEAAVALSDARSRLLRDLPHSPEAALSMTQLEERFKDLSATTIERARDVLMAHGDVLRVGKGRKGDPYRYWAPVPEEDDELHSAPLRDESGQNEISVEEDYPRSAWDPDAGEDDPQVEPWLVSPVRAPDAGSTP